MERRRQQVAKPPGSKRMQIWALEVVRRRLAVFARELRRLERSPDPDAIHDVRVASRRLRAALRHLEPCFRKRDARSLRDAARKVARLLGEARDLDIMLENLARDAARKGSPLARLAVRLRTQRNERLRQALPEARWLRGLLPGWKERLVG
jgi:CHAD domain-containing protein